MAKIAYDSLRVPTHFSAGISAGGQETSSEVISQPVWLAGKVFSAASVKIFIPINSIIMGTFVLNDTVNAGATASVGIAGNLVAYLAALTAIDVKSLAWLAVPILHAAQEPVIITPATWTSGTARVGIIVMLPKARA